MPLSSSESSVSCLALPSSPVNALLMVITEPRSSQLDSCMEAPAAAFLGHYCWHRPSSKCSGRERGRGEGLLDQMCHCIVLTAEVSLGIVNYSARLSRGFSAQASASLLATPGWVKLPPAACNVIPHGGEVICLPCSPCL